MTFYGDYFACLAIEISLNTKEYSLSCDVPEVILIFKE
jgi:hypothetical protein